MSVRTRGEFRGVIWHLKRLGTPRNWYISLSPGRYDLVQIDTPCAAGDALMDSIHMTRRDARLLAKRINQMLDETK